MRGVFGAERVLLFSDAVVAIAITLLALELTAPAGDTDRVFWNSVHENLDDYLAFGISSW